MRYFTGLDRVLLDCIESGDAAPYLQLMKKFGVQTIESELRCLEPEFGSSPDLLLAFLKVTKMALLSHKDYELTQSYLALFLKVSKNRNCRLAKFPYMHMCASITHQEYDVHGRVLILTTVLCL